MRVGKGQSERLPRSTPRASWLVLKGTASPRRFEGPKILVTGGHGFSGPASAHPPRERRAGCAAGAPR